MAKITINGTNLLQDLNDDWGGENNTGSTQEIYGTQVPEGSEWGMNRGEVERFIKAQLGSSVGDFHVVPNSDNTANVLVAFRTNDDYLDWNSLEVDDKWGSVGQQYLLTSAILPSAEGSDAFTVSLILQANPEPIQPNTNVKINVKGTSQVIHPNGQAAEDVQETLIVEIQTRTSTSASWQTRGSVAIDSNQPTYTEVDLQPYLYTGMNYVRLHAVGENATSIWRSFSVNVVNLTLALATPFERPISGNALSLRYYIGGAISKSIRFEFGTGTGASFVRQHWYNSSNENIAAACNKNIGEGVDTSTGMTFEFTNQTLLNDIFSDGVHTVRAQLYATESLHSEWVENQYMVNNGSLTTPFVAVNNYVRRHENWTEVKLFDWAAYTGGTGTLEVHFSLKSEDGTTTYLEWTFNAANETIYPFTTQLGIELENDDITAFGAFMHITDSHGNALSSPIPFTFGNSATNHPVTGADFILSPSSRNNAESNPATIINARNGAVVSSLFTGFGFVTDGWMEVNKDVNSTALNAEKIRALHIPANRKLKIEYNPFSDFTSADSHAYKYATFEIDFRTSNIVDDTEPIFVIKAGDNDAIGFTLRPTEAYLITSASAAIDDQNVSWAEDRRTRLTVHVQYNITGTQTGTVLNLVRIFLDGIIEREFFYSNTDRFTASNAVMTFGSTSADIDIFGIRCYKDADHPLSVKDVMQNYKASLSSVAEKVAFNELNDILDDQGNISWGKCNGKYNIIGHTGHLPKYGDENKGATSGVTLDIHIVGDDAHSGTLTNLDSSGQGTTAMTYYDWNQQYKITGSSVFTPVIGQPTAAGTGYAVQEGEALAKKLVGKINFASSMQAHKIGLTRIYNDLFKRLVQNGKITEPAQITADPSARIAVFEKPFLFFHREHDGDPWVFKYLMTFGSAKGDKPTFGYSNSSTPDMLMVEGANNDRPLALFRVPWNDDVTYDPDEESWMYNGQSQLDFGIGKTEKINGDEFPSSTAAINKMKDFFNFVYLHYSRLNVFSGNLSGLRASATVDKTKMYWVTMSDSSLNSNQFDLYRYDNITNSWVDAGVAKVSSGRYAKLNLLTQYNSFCQDLGVTPGTIDTEAMFNDTNTLFQGTRRAHFKLQASDYIHVDDALYHSCFVKFYAGTDNRAKNTYYYTDPSDLKIRFMQDDLDTMIKTNNLGQNRKPYYVEEHDTNPSGEYYWQGESSGLYNLLEESFTTEMTTMMYDMMAGMAQLGGSTIAFHEQFFLSTQDYFPATAYNAQAQLVYENAAIAQANNIYQNGTVQAITQSVGSQRWSEYQWLLDRIMYISSWCEYGEFAGSSSASGALSWTGTATTYNITLTPAKWMYPRIGNDSGNQPASPNGRVRVPAFTPFAYQPFTTESDSRVFIRGINYLLDIGNFNIAVSSDQGTFDFTGRKLQRITVNPNGNQTNVFNVNAITISGAINIKEFTVRNVSTLRGGIDLTKCTRLEKIDLRGCETAQGAGVAELRTSDCSSLNYLYLPSSINTLVLVAPLPTMDFIMESMEKMEILSVSRASNVAYSLLSRCYDEGAQLESFTADVAWTTCTLEILDYLVGLTTCNISGTIALDATEYMRLEQKISYLSRWGNIDDVNNSLYISYLMLNISVLQISGQKYFSETGTTQFSVDAGYGNNILITNGKPALTWSIENNNYIEIIDSLNGIARINRLNDAGDETRYLLTVTAQLVSGETVSGTWKVGAYRRLPVRGDFAYADGTFDDEIHGASTIVGFVFHTNDVMEGGVYTKRYVEICSFGWPFVKSKDGTINTYSFPWGIAQGTGRDNIPSALVSEISAASNGATLYNFAVSGENDMEGKVRTTALVNTAKAVINGYIASMWDSTDLSQYESMVSDNEQVAMYRVKALSTQRQLPRTPEELGDMMEALEAKMRVDGQSYVTRFRQLFFPAGYVSYLFEPSVRQHEVLHDSYKRNSWYTPASGTIKSYIYPMYHASRGKNSNNLVSSTYANEDNTVADADYPILSNLMKRMEDAGANVYDLKLFENNTSMRASNEISVNTSRDVSLTNGVVTQNSAANNKVYNYQIRPCAMYIYNLV